MRYCTRTVHVQPNFLNCVDDPRTLLMKKIMSCGQCVDMDGRSILWAYAYGVHWLPANNVYFDPQTL